MRQEKRPSHKKRNIVLLVLLAIVCIGGVELAACSHFAPEHYQQITAPVRRAAAAVSSFCRNAYGRASQAAVQLWENLTTRPEQPAEDADLDNQLASEPTLVSDTPISDPAITELTLIDGQEILTGGVVNVVYFNQGEEPWASQPYGSDAIAGYGCGPTTMAMAVASLTDAETDPAAMAQWAVDHGHWARRSGSHHSIVQASAQANGLESESFTGRTPDELIETILSGKLIVALMGPGHFTQRGHFILLRGVTLSGEILVADPNSLERSLIAWDPQLILDELSVNAASGGPLWTVSPPPPTF